MNPFNLKYLIDFYHIQKAMEFYKGKKITSIRIINKPDRLIYQITGGKK